MGMQGDLRTTKLGDVFQMLGNNPDLQVLTVRSGEEEKKFFFTPSGINIATEGKKLGPIGNLFVTLGKINEAQLNNALIQQRQSGGKLGEVLVESGLVSQDDVNAVFRMQMEEEIYDVMEWAEGTFSVDPCTEDQLTGTRGGLNVMSLLMEAARRADEWTSIRSVIDSMDDIWTRSEAWDINDDDPALSPKLHSIYKLLDGTYQVRGMIEKLLLPRFEVMAVLRDLAVAGKVRKMSGEELMKMADVFFKLGKRESGYDILERALVLDPNNKELREKIVETYIAGARKKEAAYHIAGLVALYAQEGNHTQAYELAQKGLKQDRYNFPLRQYVFETAMVNQNAEEAVTSGRYMIGHHAEKQAHDDAISIAQRVLAVCQDNVEFHSKLVELYLEKNDMNSALSVAEKMENVVPPDSLEMIKIYRQLSAKFPGKNPATRKLTTLVRKRRVALLQKYAVIGVICLGIILGAIFGLLLFDWIDNILNL